MTEDRVVITGTGMVCALGKTPEEGWDALLSGKTGIRPIEGFDAGGFACTSAAQIRDLNVAELGVHPRDARIMDTHSYLLMKSTRDAFQQAGLDRTSIPREEIGFFAGMGMVDYEAEDLLPAVVKSLDGRGHLDYSAFYSQAYMEIYPLWPLKMLNNIGFCQVATQLDIQGENTVFSPHGDSGAMAVTEGMKSVRSQRAQVVLCGGVGEKVNPSSLARAHLSGILNTEDPQEGFLCRPFAMDRKGSVLGEGSAVVALELESSARNRGVPMVASVTGYGCSCEISNRHSGPTARALSLAMRKGLDRAGLKSSEIDLIIAHGDGTVSADGNEIEAIHDVFSDCLNTIHVFSSKAAVGHLLAGAPLIDLILGVRMLTDGIVPAMPHTSPPDPSIRFHVVQGTSLRRNVRRILINCQSYEGQAASLVLETVNR
jgi:3-oxoacyl-[acyl-carrier-protein] synthase II